MQRTGSSFKQLLNALVANKNIDTAVCNTPEDRYGLLQRNLANRKAVYDSVEAATSKLVRDYQKIYDLLLKNKPLDTSRAFLYSLRTIIKRIDYLQYMLQFVNDGDLHKRGAARDIAMAENIKWLMTHIYKNEKRINIYRILHN